MAVDFRKQSHEQKRSEPKSQMLLHSRRVTHPIDDMKDHPNICSPLGVKHIMGLDHQMEISLQELSQKLAREGKQYELSIKREERPKPIGSDSYGKSCYGVCCHVKQSQSTHWLTRWHVYANGYEIALLDDNYAYDCFDISSTCFMENIECVLNESGVQPLTGDEVKALELVRMALRIIEVE